MWSLNSCISISQGCFGNGDFQILPSAYLLSVFSGVHNAFEQGLLPSGIEKYTEVQ